MIALQLATKAARDDGRVQTAQADKKEQTLPSNAFLTLAEPDNNCIFNSRFNSIKCGLSQFLKGTRM